MCQGTEREEGHVELGAAAHDEGPQCLVTTFPFVVDGHQVWLLGRLAVDNQLLGKETFVIENRLFGQ